jgi:class 3 adenylate cyclase
MSTDHLDPDELALLAAFSAYEDDNAFDEDATFIGCAIDVKPRVQGLALRLGEQVQPLPPSPAIIGRDPTCNVRLDSRSVSRAHAAIYRLGHHYVVRDLHSTNGVLLNQVLVSQAPIRAGDHLQISDQHLEIVASAETLPSYQNQCTVLFFDLSNSTRLIEQHGPSFNHMLQGELSKLEDRILQAYGCPIKNLGDGLMAAFGLWPIPSPLYHPGIKALEIANTMAQHMAQIPAFPGLHVRIGLSYGPVTPLEKENHLDLFGDTVNLAARLEQANKEYQTGILLSGELADQLPNRQRLQEIDTVRVAGRDTPVTLYTWLPLDSSTDLATYQAGLAAYRHGSWREATALLSPLSAQGDGPAQALCQRMENLGGAAPKRWDGIWQLQK